MDPERVGKILGQIRAGVPKEAAARIAGIGASTLFEWMQRDVEFAEAVQRAVAESEAVLVARIAKAAGEPRHWTAAAWMLERRFPERYAKRDILQHQGSIGVDVTLQRLREIRERAEARKRDAGAK
jgi:transposase